MAAPGYSHIPEVVDSNVEAPPAPQGAPQESGRLRQRGLWASVLFALLLVGAFVSHRSSIVKRPKQSLDTFLTRVELPDSGVCGQGTACSKDNCCTKAGYKCVKQSEGKDPATTTVKEGGKKTKAPKIQRLVTPSMLQRKRNFRSATRKKMVLAKKLKTEYSKRLSEYRQQQKELRAAEVAKKKKEKKTK